MKRAMLIGMSVLLSAASSYAEVAPKIVVDWRYQNAATQAIVSETSSASLTELASTQKGTTDAGIYKSIYLVKVAKALQVSLESYEKACQKLPVHPFPGEELPRRCRSGDEVSIPELPHCLPPKPDQACQQAQVKVSRDLFATVADLSAELSSLALRDSKVTEVLDMTRALAANMEKNAGKRPSPVYDSYPMPGRGGAAPGQAKSGQLRVTAGGAKDIAFIRKLIAAGEVPSGDSLVIEGFLSEFDLPLASKGCADLICLQPAVAIDRDARKLYVQVGMESGLDVASFKRRPLNLGLVIDISGSMSATDNTEKSRLEWAKEATIQMLSKLNANDIVTIVIFDGDSETLVAPTTIADRDTIVAKVKALQPRGSTNVESGLRRGYELVSSKARPDYENRLILISDAGANTGVTDQGIIGRMVAQYAGERIGLTTIGLGENFNQELVHHITQSQGGNYLFVQSGTKMLEFFHQFDFLVTPVAYNFKARLGIEGLKAKIAGTYGVPADAGEPARDMLDVRTLFFTSSGGGAMLLEYDLL